MRGARRAVSFLLAALFAATCPFPVLAQTPGPVPRSIDDVLARLQNRAPSAFLAEQEAIVRSEPPAGAGTFALLRFHQRRVRAAAALGNLDLMVGDARRLAELVRESMFTRGGAVERDVLIFLGNAEYAIGNLAGSLAAYERAARLSTHGWYTAALGWVARLHAEMGDLARADQVLRETENHVAAMRGDLQTWSRNQEGHISSLERARAMVLYARGRYAEAEVAARTAVSSLETYLGRAAPAEMENLQSGLIGREVELVQILARRGNPVDAEWFARRALQRALEFEIGGSGLVVYAMTALGMVTHQQGRFAEAQALFAAVRRLYSASDTTRGSKHYATMLSMEGDSLAALGRHAEAVQRYDEARATARGEGILSSSLPFWGLALTRAGRAADAAALLGPMIDALGERYGGNHPGVARMRGVRALALDRAGKSAQARDEFAESVSILLDPRAIEETSPADSVLLRAVIEGYVALLARQREPAAIEQAFRLADVIRGRSVQLAVASSAARAHADTPELGDLVRREQDLRNELAALYEFLNRMSTVPPEARLPRVVAEMRRRIAEIGPERETLARDIDRRFPEYARLVRPQPATLAQAQAALHAGEALLSVLVTPERSFVWAVPKSGAPALHVSALSGREVNTLVASLRRSLDPGDAGLDQMPPLDLAAARRLYDELLRPLESVWGGARQLLVASNGALTQLPFPLLVTGESPVSASGGPRFSEYRTVPWLARRAAVTQLPSVNALLALRALPQGRADRLPFAGFGDPRFARIATAAMNPGATRLRNLGIVRPPAQASENLASAGGASEIPATSPAASVPPPATAPAAPASDWMRYEQIAPLPDTREEIVAIARALKADPARDAFFGPDASKQRLRSIDLSRRRVLAFATHGLIPGDFPGLTQPALALAAPEDPKENGLLTLDEILRLKLDADWVVLSACNTAAGDGAGADAISGLGRAFFYAGSRALLVTHWPVETVSARKLVTGIFERFTADAKLTRAEALRQSMLALMEESGPGYSYAHPIFWAPYALVGDGAGTHR